MSGAMLADSGEYLFKRSLFAFGIPGRVGRVAPGTAEIAAAEADEDAGNAGQDAFALNGVKDLADFQAG